MLNDYYWSWYGVSFWGDEYTLESDSVMDA